MASPTTTNGRSTESPRTAPRPDQVGMPLLDRIVRQSLDEDYEVVAGRKAAEARPRPRRAAGRPRDRLSPAKPPPPPGRPRRVAAAVMAVFGVIVTIAAVQTSRDAPEATASRASLVLQVQARRDNVAGLQARLERLRESTTDLRTTVAQGTEDQQALAARVERLEGRTGFAPVTGPGIRITVDDAPQGDVAQTVRDSDLATLVDGLWDAGA